MLGGYTGKVLNIDLTTGNIEIEKYPDRMLRKYLGASGIAAKILYDRTDENTDPLGPENHLIYMTGPFTGTRVPSSGRHEITAKSPLTGIFGEGDVGGTWGVNLKRAGYDGIIIHGKAEKPVYILVEEGQVSILDGEHLWGLDTIEVDEKLKETHGPKTVTSCIGPAGEKQVLIASIMHDGKDARAVGRAGLGAVMGSKNLKAIAVIGSGKVDVADEEGLKECLKKSLPKIIANTQSLKQLGTAGGAVMAEKWGDIPVKNWSRGDWESIKNISGEKMAKTILKKRYFCGSCPIGCGRDIEIKEGPYKGVSGAGPEYETIGLLGSNCMVDDLEAIAYANELCNRLGIDSISTGSAIAFAMELYERGIIDERDTDGVKLDWGNGEAMIEMVKKIGSKEGIGELLGKGVKRASEEIGGIAPEFAVHVKGLELPAHDPRAMSSLAVGYATSNRGACHLHAGGFYFEKGVTMPELGYTEMQDRLSSEGKGQLTFHSQNIMCILDSLKLCKMLLFGKVTLTEIVEWIKYTIGWDDFTVEELLMAGERIFNLQRLYNVEYCSISRKDDVLPPRILSQPRLDRGTGDYLPPLGKMLYEYYQIRGWTMEGIPSEEKIKELDLDDRHVPLI
ncbi:aldehyde ferredoxin oxidoreductase family protein [Tepidimicrobium xylanilyticum]|uniref:Aldehyde:ferredoxin oxidoreductase n=1 Tax=Tepidimicrobium xylanilyticum TaxID=1123352 RepID=A0A1H2QLZ8_9FIRM|nr:aldehyde ferredoxin oxidoreductase family protein [Tepidimicrobium xylanilyticum]SDW08233.1 aldehyde:ferredoxin oxidoreductase [Tepidimicrobium xylanilyticum]